MLIHPWDAALDEEEWRGWLAEGHDFGAVAVNSTGELPPLVIPTHFVADGDEILVHLARANPGWPAIEARPHVLLSVFGDYAFIPSAWRLKAGATDESGVPTSYYSAVQLACRAEIVDEPEGKAELLRRQLAHFQPSGDHAPVLAGQPPYGPMLAAIRGLRLHVASVQAKFKYDDQKPEAHRETVADRLDLRGEPQDARAAAQQRRRLHRMRPPLV